jgi:hypothetical protein
MISLSSGASTLLGKPVLGAPAAVALSGKRGAEKPTVARPVPPAEAARAADPTRDSVADAPAAGARRALAAAVRSAALNRAALPTGPEVDAPSAPFGLAPAAATAAWREKMLARIASPGGLPLLPEPSSPARSAFAEAVLALRTGIGRDGAAGRAADGA